MNVLRFFPEPTCFTNFHFLTINLKANGKDHQGPFLWLPRHCSTCTEDADYFHVWYHHFRWLDGKVTILQAR